MPDNTTLRQYLYNSIEREDGTVCLDIKIRGGTEEVFPRSHVSRFTKHLQKISNQFFFRIFSKSSDFGFRQKKLKHFKFYFCRSQKFNRSSSHRSVQASTSRLQLSTFKPSLYLNLAQASLGCLGNKIHTGHRCKWMSEQGEKNMGLNFSSSGRFDNPDLKTRVCGSIAINTGSFGSVPPSQRRSVSLPVKEQEVLCLLSVCYPYYSASLIHLTPVDN